MSILGPRPTSLSAQQVDPASWVTGPYVPLVFGGLTLLYGTVMAIATLPDVRHPVAQFAAAALFGLAGLVLHLATRPSRPPLGWAGGILTLLIGTCALMISALGYIGARFTLEVWWAPLALAFVLASLGPYLSLRRLVVLESATILVGGPLAYPAVAPQVPFWGPVSIAIMIMLPIMFGMVVATTFSAMVVRRVLPMLENRSQVLVSLDAIRSEEAEEAERRRLAEMSVRVVPFLERVAEAGVVTSADRALSGLIARQLRDDLVARSNRSWLDTVAETDGIVVIDPERRANRMRSSQRTALRTLLRGILTTPGADAGSVLVELRGQPDGATAVAVSLDVDLPEGRRIMHLAPFYLSLHTTVRDLRWDDVRHLRFELPDE